MKSELDVIASELSNLELAAQEERQEGFYALTSEQVSQANFFYPHHCVMSSMKYKNRKIRKEQGSLLVCAICVV